MEKFIHYENSIFNKDEVLTRFNCLSNNKGVALFEATVENLSFKMSGEVVGDTVHVKNKKFEDENGHLQSYIKNKPKIYAEIFYKPNGKPELITNYKNSVMDSYETAAPSYEIFNEHGTEKLWYVRGENKTHLVRNFCRENEINENEMSQDDIELILMNIAKPN